MQRSLFFAAMIFLAPTLSAAAEIIPLPGGYCDGTIRLDANQVKFEDGACQFRSVSTMGNHQWRVTTDCEAPNAELIVSTSIDDGAAAFLDTSGDAPYPLRRCPDTPAS